MCGSCTLTSLSPASSADFERGRERGEKVHSSWGTSPSASFTDHLSLNAAETERDREAESGLSLPVLATVPVEEVTTERESM